MLAVTLQLALPNTLWLRLPPELRDAYETAIRHVRYPHAENTKLAYERAWTGWAAHCQLVQVEALPAHPLHVIGYLNELSKTMAPNTVRLQLSAIAAIDLGHAAARQIQRPSLRRHPIVARWLKGWSKKNPSAPRRRARALQPTDLEHVIATAAEPGFNQSRVAHAARFARDKALIVLGVGGALRVSELCDLQLEHLTLRPRGVRVFVARAKNDQGGFGKERVVLAQKRLCPVEALEQWLRVRGAAAGPVFCPIARGGLLELEPDGARLRRLSYRQAMRMVTDRLRAGGFVAGGTSHAMRVTCATLMKDEPLSAVMAHGNWRTPRIVADYQRQGDLWDDDANPTSGLFDG